MQISTITGSNDSSRHSLNALDPTFCPTRHLKRNLKVMIVSSKISVVLIPMRRRKRRSRKGGGGGEAFIRRK